MMLKLQPSIKVKSGESLWSIAQKYNTSVENIKQNNNLNNNMVFPGQVINVGGSASQALIQTLLLTQVQLLHTL